MTAEELHKLAAENSVALIQKHSSELFNWLLTELGLQDLPDDESPEAQQKLANLMGFCVTYTANVAKDTAIMMFGASKIDKDNREQGAKKASVN